LHINDNTLHSIELVTTVHGEAGIHELRRRQATAIVLVGVIGAEFAHEIDDPSTGTDSLARAASELLFTHASYLSSNTQVKH
jgi:hypothetical protein